MNALVPFDAKSRSIPIAEDDRLLDSLHVLTDLLIRRRTSLVGCIAICLLLACAYLAISPPKFTASATIIVDEEHTDVIHQDATVADAQILNAMTESQVEVLRSIGLARQVVDQLRLTSDPFFRHGVTGNFPGSGTGHDVDAADHTAQLRERTAQQLLRQMSVKSA